jgi:hypothetical protein
MGTNGHGLRCIIAPIRARRSIGPDLEHVLRGLDPLPRAPLRHERARAASRKWIDGALSTLPHRIPRIVANGPDCVKTRKSSENGASGANFFALPSL